MNGFVSFAAVGKFNPSFVEVFGRPFKARTDLNIPISLRYSPGSCNSVPPPTEPQFVLAGKPRSV